METEVKEPAVLYQKSCITEEEFLEMEAASEIKHEYYKGEVFAMAGAKIPHNTISGNLFLGIGNHLKRKLCRPFTSDQSIYIEKNGLYTYPGMSIVCGKIETRKNRMYIY